MILLGKKMFDFIPFITEANLSPEQRCNSHRKGKPMTSNARIEALLLAIAQKHIPSIETLEERKSDDLDFHDIAVWSLHDALKAAYEAGRATR